MSLAHGSLRAEKLEIITTQWPFVTQATVTIL